MKFQPVKWLERHQGIAWCLVLLCMVSIFILSSISHPPQPAGVENPLISPIEHAVEYGTLGFLLLGAFLGNERFRRYAPILAIAVAILYGITDEIHQFFVPYREADVFDVLMDGIGAVIGTVIGKIW